MNRNLIDRLLSDGSLLSLEAAAELQRIAREQRRLPHGQTITIPREQWPGPDVSSRAEQPVVIDATSRKALAYRPVMFPPFDGVEEAQMAEWGSS